MGAIPQPPASLRSKSLNQSLFQPTYRYQIALWCPSQIEERDRESMRNEVLDYNYHTCCLVECYQYPRVAPFVLMKCLLITAK